MSELKTYRLGSNSLVHAPGVVAFAIDGYRYEKDRQYALDMITACWPVVPEEAARALLSLEAPYTVEGNVVVFTHGAPVQS
jgi:hypothetical protein